MAARPALIAAVALPLFLLAGCKGGEQPAGDSGTAAASAAQGRISTLDAATLAGKLKAGEVELVDVRTPEEFAAGHIPGAVNMPLESFDPAALPHVEGKQTVLYCHSGRRSGLAAEAVAATGADAVHLQGGISAWESAGEPVAK
ncbi:MAG: rhodanese-like domain-containing protein [Sphingomonadales bacterium]|nr:rhodanese-like domain-containing protein [Sphingomonadales bacterium]MBD3772945.1 rhodanese-like domain-containing protein [Paracoccaceae bacterium]